MLTERERQFLLAVRRLEKEYNTYIQTSEWLCLEHKSEMDEDRGIFAAALDFCPSGKKEFDYLVKLAAED